MNKGDGLRWAGRDKESSYFGASVCGDNVCTPGSGLGIPVKCDSVGLFPVEGKVIKWLWILDLLICVKKKKKETCDFYEDVKF